MTKVVDRILMAERRKLYAAIPKMMEVLRLPQKTNDEYVGWSDRFQCRFVAAPHTYLDPVWGTSSLKFNPWLHCCLNREDTFVKPTGWIGNYHDAHEQLDAARYTGKYNHHLFYRATHKQYLAAWGCHILRLQHEPGNLYEFVTHYMQEMNISLEESYAV